jgi:hypothetical protein
MLWSPVRVDCGRTVPGHRSRVLPFVSQSGENVPLTDNEGDGQESKSPGVVSRCIVLSKCNVRKQQSIVFNYLRMLLKIQKLLSIGLRDI